MDEFSKRLSNAKEAERQFFEAFASGRGNKEDSNKIVDSYMYALDAADAEDYESEKEILFFMSDFRFKQFMLLLPKQGNRPFTQPEVKTIIDSLVSFLVMALEEEHLPDKYKAAYTKKKEEIIAAFNEELRKNGIGIKSGGCYIATSIYGSYDCQQVLTLRSYRDNKLAKNTFGRFFIRIYYAVSPKIVEWFSNYAWFNRLGKRLLDKLVKNLSCKGYSEKL